MKKKRIKKEKEKEEINRELDKKKDPDVHLCRSRPNNDKRTASKFV